jgi:hypothetical protein
VGHSIESIGRKSELARISDLGGDWTGRDLGLVEGRLGLLLGFAFGRYSFGVFRCCAVLRTDFPRLCERLVTEIQLVELSVRNNDDTRSSAHFDRPHYALVAKSRSMPSSLKRYQEGAKRRGCGG